MAPPVLESAVELRTQSPLMRVANSRFFIMWAVLVGLTLFSWESAIIQGTPGLGASIVLFLVWFKVRLIGLEFMELRHAPILMRIFYELWGAGVMLIIAAQYWGLFR